jgi:hypothetical protein
VVFGCLQFRVETGPKRPWSCAEGVRLSKIQYYLVDNLQTFMLSELHGEVKRKAVGVSEIALTGNRFVDNVCLRSSGP